MAIYINGIGVISPQASFEGGIQAPLAEAEAAFFSCQEPVYKQYIPRKILRRMSRVVRMGLSSAQKALGEQAPEQIDAIVAGTAWGCVQDTEKFLDTIVEHQEQYLTPTAFVQSTHNTVAGQIALLQKNNGYNMTYVQGVVSFETALLDASLLLAEQRAQQVLAIGIDELTPQLKQLLEHLNCAQVDQPMGEGSNCFILSQTANTETLAQVSGVRTLYRPKEGQITTAIEQLLATANSSPEEVDLILSTTAQPLALANWNTTVPRLGYEHLCGYYPTNAAFGMAMAAQLLQGDASVATALDWKASSKPKQILIFNQHESAHCGLILLKAPH